MKDLSIENVINSFKEIQLKTLMDFINWEDSLSDNEHDRIGSMNGEINGINTIPQLAYYIKEVLKIKS